MIESTVSLQYALKIMDDSEAPCHLSEIKVGDVYCLVSGSHRSERFIATVDAFISEVNKQLVWSIPHELHQ